MFGWPLIFFFFCEECYNRPPNTEGWFSIWDDFFGSSPPCWFLSLLSSLFLNLTAHGLLTLWKSTCPKRNGAESEPTAGFSFCFRRNLSSRVSQGIADGGKWQPLMGAEYWGREGRAGPHRQTLKSRPVDLVNFDTCSSIMTLHFISKTHLLAPSLPYQCSQ